MEAVDQLMYSSSAATACKHHTILLRGIQCIANYQPLKHNNSALASDSTAAEASAMAHLASSLKKVVCLEVTEVVVCVLP